MKYDKYLQTYKNNKWYGYYVDYAYLKKTFKHKNEDIFWKLVKQQLSKINIYCRHFRNNLAYFQEINQYVILNYMAIFKSIKNSDKNLCKSSKQQFFELIKKQEFYNNYFKQKREKRNIKCVIFDKNGTLFNFRNIFHPWLLKQMEELSYYIDNLHEACLSLGYNMKSGNFEGNGVIAKGTNEEIRKAIINYIKKQTPELTEQFICNLVKNKWIQMPISNDHIQQSGNIHSVCALLKERNIKIAISTSDDRKTTMNIIKLFKLQTYIDIVICGDDPISNKPSPEPIWKICGKLGIQLSETMMVGDTICDINTGLNAKCGYVLGVLSGAHDSNDLENADEILKNINGIPSYIRYIENSIIKESYV